MSPVSVQKVMQILRLSVMPASRPSSPSVSRQQQEIPTNTLDSVSE